MSPKLDEVFTVWNNVLSVDFKKRVSSPDQPIIVDRNEHAKKLVSLFAWNVQQALIQTTQYVHSPSFDIKQDVLNVRTVDFKNRIEVDWVFDTVSKTKLTVWNRLCKYGQEIGMFIHQLNEAFAQYENVFSDKRYQKYISEIASGIRSTVSDQAYVSWIRHVGKNYWFTKNEIVLYTRIHDIEIEYSKRIDHLVELLETIKRGYEVLRVSDSINAESYSYLLKKLPELFSESCLKLWERHLNGVWEMVKSVWVINPR